MEKLNKEQKPIAVPSPGSVANAIVVRRFFRNIKRWWYKQAVYESMMDDIIYGKFRVHYKDGCQSIKMCYKNAKSYASIFGGEVIDAF